LLSIAALLAVAACSEITAVPVGGPCSYDDTCMTGLCIRGSDANGQPTAWAGGYCSGNCADTACPEGSCLALADGLKYCVATCSADGDCRAGYVCAKAVSACLPDCRKGWSCGSTLVCNSASGNCEVAVASGGG
jgi:hypothetical protein